MKYRIRQAEKADFEGVVSLLTEFGNAMPIISGEDGRRHWEALLLHAGTRCFVAEVDGDVRSISIVHVLPNMTNMGRPYALIENVITSTDYRKHGLARAVMQAVIEFAWSQDAYKIMLLTGKQRGDGSALGFYQKLGFSDDDKHGLTLRRVARRG